MNPRSLLLELYDAALREVDGNTGVAGILANLGAGPVALFAIGKAASTMTRGAYAAIGTDIRQALLITKDGHTDPEVARFPHLRVIESAHPVPDARSLAAGAELERRIAALSADEYPVFLISGGSSSLVELLGLHFVPRRHAFVRANPVGEQHIIGNRNGSSLRSRNRDRARGQCLTSKTASERDRRASEQHLTNHNPNPLNFLDLEAPA
jgi:hypothetical protein